MTHVAYLKHIVAGARACQMLGAEEEKESNIT